MNMGWTDLSTGVHDFTALSILNEFVAAVSEREVALGDSPPQLVGEEWDYVLWPFSDDPPYGRRHPWNLIDVISYIQGKAHDFVQNKVTVTGADITNYNGQPAITMWTPENLWATVNGDAAKDGGPPCYTSATGEPDGYRFPQQWDYPRIETFIAVQKALNLMVWTKNTGDHNWSGDDEQEAEGGGLVTGYDPSFGTWAEAITYATNDYAIDPDPGNKIAASGYCAGRLGFQAECRRTKNKSIIRFSDLYGAGGVPLVCELDLYYQAQKPYTGIGESVFDGQGYCPVGENQYWLFDAANALPAETLEFTAEACGGNLNNPPPNWPAEPNSTHSYRFKGWRTTVGEWVMRWNVTQGFEYV